MTGYHVQEGPINLSSLTVATLQSHKDKWKPSPKFYSSSEHFVKAYADDVTLISDSLEVHVSLYCSKLIRGLQNQTYL